MYTIQVGVIVIYILVFYHFRTPPPPNNFVHASYILHGYKLNGNVDAAHGPLVCPSHGARHP